MRNDRGTGGPRAPEWLGTRRHKVSGAIVACSASADERLGAIFRNMRRILNVPAPVLARHLSTSPATIGLLEAGALAALPPWPETTRIIHAYCALLRADPQPILRHLAGQLTTTAAPRAGAAVSSPASPGISRHNSLPPRTTLASAPPAQRAPAEATTSSQSRRRTARRLFALSAPAALIAAVVSMVQMMPKPVHAVIEMLPDPIKSSVYGGIEFILLQTAPRRDGLRWIEVSDPQTRKADKLQAAQR
jgi:hypothetical protein